LLALLASLLVSSWTTFETLAGDLWESAVNARPKLAANVSKSIKIDMLQKHGPQKLGTILREQREAGFATLEEIRISYKRAFVEHGDRVQASLIGNALDALALARNLIVHKASRCDEEYARRSKGLPQLPQLEIGQELLLNGSLVRSLVEPATIAARDLIAAVGSWMRTHPE